MSPCRRVPASPAATLLLSAEDRLSTTIAPRLQAADADLSYVAVIPSLPSTHVDERGRYRYEERPPVLPDDLDYLENAILATGARLVVVDPLAAFLAPGIYSGRDRDVRRALAPLDALAERTGVALVGVAHLNKAAHRSAGHRIHGSIALLAVPRSVLLLAADPDDASSRVLAALKPNLAAPPPSLAFCIESCASADVSPAAALLPGRAALPTALAPIDAPAALLARQRLAPHAPLAPIAGQRPAPHAPLAPIAVQGTPRLLCVGVSPHTAETLLARPTRPAAPPRSALEQALAFLSDLLTQGPLPANEVFRQAQAAGIALRTLRRASTRIAILIEKESMSGGWVWRLPSGEDG